MRNRIFESLVGVFILLGAVAFFILALKVSGLSQLAVSQTYNLWADFDNIGSLKIRAPVRVAGVSIGIVDKIMLDSETFRARVYLAIDKNQNNLPTDSEASIYTEGLLGSNYISITPGFDRTVFKDNNEITATHSALILESLVGKLIFNIQKN